MSNPVVQIENESASQSMPVLDQNLIVSSVRRGIPLAEQFRADAAEMVRANFRQSSAVQNTAAGLAKRCVGNFRQYAIEPPEGWAEDIEEEIIWWWIHSLHKIEDGTISAWFNQHERPFRFEPMMADASIKDVKLLDIGSGPRSMVATKSDHYCVDVCSVDPLADAYNAVFDLLAVDAPKITFGAVEILEKLPFEQKFDLVVATNCLDHSYDVLAGLASMEKVLKQTGSIVLEHWVNEGEAQKYVGLHQWNMEIEDDQLRVWNKDSSSKFMHQDLGFSIEHKVEKRRKGTVAGEEHDFLTVVFKRCN